MPQVSLAERFNRKVVVSPSGCHEWTGHVMPNGYGQVSKNGRPAYVHRVSYELHKGPIPDGLYVLHSCDNRKCVNPDHLSVGTFYDNMADMVSKQRQVHGERVIHAKLTEAQVQEIREASGVQREIAAKYGVTQPLVSMIRNGRIWRVAKI